MSESKIRQRALILQEIAKLRLLNAVCDKDIEASIFSLSSIEDKTFLCSTILKEISGKSEYFDGVLAILAINLAKECLEKCIFTLLEKPAVSDEKKLFLINLLNQAGYNVDPGLIRLYVNDADKLVDLETEKFLQMAEVNPEAQIDFLDFYFGIGEYDRNILLASIINDYSGDLLANILAPLIYSINDENVLKTCIDGLLGSKSYLAYAPLEWLIKTSKSPSVVSLAKKVKNELKIAGLRKNITTFEYYSNLFSDSKPLEFLVSSLDGASNFSLIFSREYKKGTISTFFTVINLENGPISCFGLSNISKQEYDVILERFFKDTEKISLPLDFGKALIDEFTNSSLSEEKPVPYELLCWRQLTYDIKGIEGSLEDYMKNNLEKIDKVNEIDLKRAVNSDYASKWFFSYSKKYPEFEELIEKICALSGDEFEKFDDFTRETALKKEKMFFSLKKRFLYQAWFLKNLNFKNLSSLFYSIYLDNEALAGFYGFSVKKSVYEFFLNLQHIKENTDKNNIFAKQRKMKFFDFNSKKMLKLIEKKWIN